MSDESSESDEGDSKSSSESLSQRQNSRATDSIEKSETNQAGGPERQQASGHIPHDMRSGDGDEVDGSTTTSESDE